MSPHALTVPEAPSAAKALDVDAMATKPLPIGAPAPPSRSPPHALIVPAASSAAKAEFVDAIETKPLPVGAPHAP